MTTEMLPPGPERRAAMVADGLNVSDRDFTAEERVAAVERAERARQLMATEPGTPFPEAEAS